MSARAGGRLAALLLAAALAAGCGFHLREARPLHFHSLYLAASETDPYVIALRDTLSANDQLTLAPRRDDAEVQLQILATPSERAIQSLTTSGQVRELMLRQRVRFQVLDARGGTLLAATDLLVERPLSYNVPNTLSKQSEEAQIFTELRADSIRLLMLRLGALDPSRKPDEH
ncbi:MAG: hypothetical protein KGI67_12645 [Pseudomonadota bacterium]|nr:hypothetical protein [Pseudomonadota bacterium]